MTKLLPYEKAIKEYAGYTKKAERYFLERVPPWVPGSWSHFALVPESGSHSQALPPSPLLTSPHSPDARSATLSLSN